MTTPGSVSVRRSYSDMMINCEKADQAPGVANVKSSTKAMAFGNIIFGGVVGAGVDVVTGAAYDYPPLITVLMGDKITVDAPPVDNAAGAKPQASADAAPTLAAAAKPAEIKP